MFRWTCTCLLKPAPPVCRALQKPQHNAVPWAHGPRGAVKTFAAGTFQKRLSGFGCCRFMKKECWHPMYNIILHQRRLAKRGRCRPTAAGNPHRGKLPLCSPTREGAGPKRSKNNKKLLSPSFRWNANSSTSIQQQHRARPHCGRDEAAKAQAGAKPFSGLWRFLKWQLEALGALGVREMVQTSEGEVSASRMLVAGWVLLEALSTWTAKTFQ